MKIVIASYLRIVIIVYHPKKKSCNTQRNKIVIFLNLYRSLITGHYYYIKTINFKIWNLVAIIPTMHTTG